jgi:hypothetical protein
MMSRRANIILLLALAAGVAYGGFGVPLLSDDTEAVVEESGGQVLSEADEIRLQMPRLKPGMNQGEAEKVLGLDNKPRAFFGFGGFSSSYGMTYHIDQRHTLTLLFDRPTGSVTTAKLYDGERLVLAFPATRVTPWKDQDLFKPLSRTSG